ncbi:MAG: TlpA family protein disulfide reductase, partial [Lentimicrobiaceae bacterium]|nr:TlpA family protein disulfide reductase [Lentimicrobiaceae bacterium]
GSTTHNLYNEYVALLEPLKEKQEHIREEYYSISYNLSIPEEKLVQMQEELIAKFEQVEEDAKIIMKDFIVAHPSSIVAAYLLYRNTQTSNDVAEIEEKLQLLNPEMNNKFVMLVKDRLERVKGKAVGATFPTIELPDPDGKIISVESLRGKYVFVDFWASWCRPCLGEIPSLKKVYEKFHDKGFEILSISLDDDKTAWKNGITTHELNWLHVSDLQAFNSPVAKKLAVSYVPHTFLLDPNGVILAVDLRGEELEIKLTELIP